LASNTNNQNAPDIHTGYPGFCYNFDPDSQTCDVQLAIESLFVSTSASYVLQKKDRLQNVPVQFIQGGGWSVTHPVLDGAPCYVHFSERGIEHWLAQGKDSAGLVLGQPAPAFSQLFSHNAAVCTIGTQPLNQTIGSFNPSAFEVRNADRSIRMTLADSSAVILAGSSTITITKDGEVAVVSSTQASVKAPQILLDGAVTITQSLTVQGGMAVSGGAAGSTFTINGNMQQIGSFTINGIRVDGHTHISNSPGDDTGIMK